MIATEILALPTISEIAEQLLAIAGKVLVGVIIFGVGLYLASLADN